MPLTQFENDNGECFVDLTFVIAVAMMKPKRERALSCGLTLKSGDRAIVYVHATEAARQALIAAGVLPETSSKWGSPRKAKVEKPEGKRGRPKKDAKVLAFDYKKLVELLGPQAAEKVTTLVTPAEDEPTSEA